MSQSYNRKVPAETTKKKNYTKLTVKQLAVYYWLLCKCHWNALEKENHYYIYKNEINQTQMAKQLGIKDTKTIRSAFHKLDECHKICLMDDVILIPHPNCFVYMDVSMIRYLLEYSVFLQIEIIQVYSILKYIFEWEDKKTICLKELVLLFGYGEHNKPAYRSMKTCLAFLQGMDIVSFTKTTKTKNGFKYLEYRIDDICTKPPQYIDCDEDDEESTRIDYERLEQIQQGLGFAIVPKE